ncbi:MAG TPA: hypothetical protein VNL14_15035 [Candidatus Acidoferrales bacterium]|nr:hypothetical protein [Candidatus Acidoferrales bacterium]
MLHVLRWTRGAPVAVELPVGLRHIDSELCWCDPTVEFDETGQPVVLHRHVTWN